MMSQSPHKKALAVVFGLLLAVGAAYLVATQRAEAPVIKGDGQALVPAAGTVVIRGTMTCLPHRDTTGPQTLECALGLRDENGTHYGLRDSDPAYANVSQSFGDALVDVTGNFEPANDEKYASVGTIEVSAISLAYVPKRASLEGVYLCLPHTDAFGPQTEECVAGIQTDDGLYYVFDLSLSSQMGPALSAGDRISASGILTPLELLSTDMWERYPVEAIFSVTDSLRKI